MDQITNHLKKGGTPRKPVGFVIKPRLISCKTNSKTMYYSYNTSLATVDASVSEFLKAKVLKRSLHFQN